MKRHEFQDFIVKKAWEDPEFKKRLLADPRAVISEELGKIQDGVSIPDNIAVDVVEETPNQICIVLPVNPADLTGAAISEDDLAKVAGGETTSTTTASVTTVSTALDVVQVIDNGVAVTTIEGSAVSTIQ